VEFALILPLIVWILFGLWEVGRITEVEEVMTNSAREAGRDASLGQEDLKTVATNLATYLQAAEPSAFAQGHATNMIAPVVTMPANTTGYTCWDTVANRELFTITFTDLTHTSVTEPTGMSQLDIFRVGVQVPYTNVGWLPTPYLTGLTRLNSSVTWTAMVDSPFTIAPSLPAE
jgi:Flp pilus assembly protein TadG